MRGISLWMIASDSYYLEGDDLGEVDGDDFADGDKVEDLEEANNSAEDGGNNGLEARDDAEDEGEELSEQVTLNEALVFRDNEG
jgi:hypothetical protein